MNIALLGFGTVGSHFYKLCEGRTDLHVAAVLSRRPRPELTCTVTADYDEIVRDPSIDIVVEVMGGIEPAYSYLCAAMRAGKHVVTANKQLMCAHFEELTSLAKEKGVALRCTAAAGGGIPWLTSLSRASELDEIKAVEGILNGTTNYMLSAMTNSGADYAPALQKAQELGYAEADPTADVEGIDAARKSCILSGLAFGKNVSPEDIHVEGISKVDALDAAFAESGGMKIKLLGRTLLQNGKRFCFVSPHFIKASALLAGVILAGILAATMSTADSQMLAAASSVSQNILQEFAHLKLSEKQSLFAARLTIVCVSVVGVVLARDPDSSVFGIVSFAWAGFGGAFGAVMLCALFWKRCNWQGALAGMLAGGLMVFVWKYLISPLGGVFGIYELLPAFLTSLVVCVVVSLVTPAPSAEIEAEFEAAK